MSNFDPSASMMEEETLHLFLCFCTFVMNTKGKKLSAQNVFVQTLQEEKLMRIMKDILNLDTDYEVVKIFLDFDPSISKSKYVTKYLNSRDKKKNGDRKAKKDL